MLAPIKQMLTNTRIVLASGSPRRQELVKSLGLNCELCPSTFEENLNPLDFSKFHHFLEATALGKAQEVYTRLTSENMIDNLLVIAADTMVTLNDEIYGKPANAIDATRMLTRLSGKTHRVSTGVVLLHSSGLRKFTEMTEVQFSCLTNEQILDYVKTGEPLDKAGAYGIQGVGGAFVPRINGDYYTVMGLPLNRLCRELLLLFQEEHSAEPIEMI